MCDDLYTSVIGPKTWRFVLVMPARPPSLPPTRPSRNSSPTAVPSPTPSAALPAPPAGADGRSSQLKSPQTITATSASSAVGGGAWTMSKSSGASEGSEMSGIWYAVPTMLRRKRRHTCEVSPRADASPLPFPTSPPQPQPQRTPFLLSHQPRALQQPPVRPLPSMRPARPGGGRSPPRSVCRAACSSSSASSLSSGSSLHLLASRRQHSRSFGVWPWQPVRGRWPAGRPGWLSRFRP